MDKYPTSEEIRSWSSVNLMDVFISFLCLFSGYDFDHDHAALLFVADLRDEILRRMGR